MKLSLLLLCFLFIAPAFAGNAVLLTSIKLNRPLHFYFETKFKRAYAKSGLNIVTHRETTPEILHQVLTDPETEILIWVSHAAADHEFLKGVGGKELILDQYGNDVKNFFSSTTPNLKFLGIVGCEAKSIFDGFTARGLYKDRPDLEIMSFSEKVWLHSGFNKTLEQSLTRAGAPTSEEIIEHIPMIDLDVTVFKPVDTEVASGWIEMGDKVIAMTAPELGNDFQIKLPLSDLEDAKNKNIRFVKSQSPTNAEAVLPYLDILSETGNWKIFADKKGNAIGGKQKQLYVFKKQN
jgi:hypothetical protein